MVSPWERAGRAIQAGAERHRASGIDEREPAKHLHLADLEQRSVLVFIPHAERSEGGLNLSMTIYLDENLEIVDVRFPEHIHDALERLGYPHGDPSVEGFLVWTARIAYRRRGR